MPSIILNNVSEPRNISPENQSVPMSFIEWNNRHVGIAFSEAEIQYRNYLQSFYKTTERVNEEKANKLKNDYIDLIKRLAIIFENDEEFQRYKNIDVTSSTDLSIAIPAYARKLKDIALFYNKKRQELKDKKLEYNLVGSYDGLEKILYSNLVSKFTKNQRTNFVYENPLVSSSPEFSAISKDFSIEIEELYDTNDYFEETESINPFTCIFNNLCFSLFTTPTSAKADPLENNYLCDPSNETVDGLLQQAYDAYLSTDVSYVSGGYYVEDYKDLTIPLESGNNFFYWFSGKTAFDIPEGIYKDVPIQSVDWTGAVGGSSMNVSDLVFISVGNLLTKGAWLQDTTFVTVTGTMSATMLDGKTFKFPYPYFGTSAFGGEWSGPGLNDTLPPDKRFFPSEEDFTETESDINKTYWNSFSSISTVQPIYLQETTLGKNGFPSNKFSNADKVYVSPESEDKQIYSGDLQVAWLYDFRQTQIPITVGVNKIYFPLQRYENASELFFTYEEGDSIPLSSISVSDAFCGAVAGTTLEESDLLIRNTNICNNEIEGAWLKAVPLKYYSRAEQEVCECRPDQIVYYTDWEFLSGGAQAGLSFKVDGGQLVRFTWTGDTIDINNVRGFTGFQHDDSCPYKREDFSTSIVGTNFLNDQNREVFEKWKKCSCQAVQYSPFGHDKTDLNYYNITPDFIVKDTGYPTIFNPKNWLGSDGKDYVSSKDSAKFFPFNLLEKDIGWGSGVWKAQTGESFILEKGKSYFYYRSDVNNCDYSSPFFVINQKYNNGTIPIENCVKTTYVPQWYKAVKDENGQWIDAGVVSDMTLFFGDFLTYTHRETTAEIKRRFLYNGVEVTSTSGNYVTIVGDDPNISFVEFSNEVPSVNFLMKIPINTEKNYWGLANYSEDVSTNRKIGIDGNDFRVVYDYLQITQPEPSRILLSDKNVLEYRFGPCRNECFLWEDTFTFTVSAPVRKWNEIIFDGCVESDILSYLNSEITNCYIRETRCLSDCDSTRTCGCEYFCNPTKIGLTATSLDSTIVFNTELSGIPMFINYYAINAFDALVTLQDITNGEKSVLVPIVTGSYATPKTPWRDLLNQNGSNFVVEENVSNLKTKKEINFYTPKKIGMNRYETFDSETTFVPNNSGVNVYRKDNYFDPPYGKKLNNSQYVTDYSLGKNQGRILSENKQTFIPYTNENEKFKKDYYGLYQTPLKFSPWNYQTGEWDGSDVYKNYRNQLNVNCDNDWYSSQLSLTGDVWNWETDVYGNSYFVVNSDPLTYSSPPSSYNTVFVKYQNNKVETMSIAMSSLLTTYSNISVSLADPLSSL
jgi:hypothetical protein